MAVFGTDLYVGGGFIESGDGMLKDLGNIVRYDIEADTWNKLPNDGLMCETIHALGVSGKNLFAGGWDITQTGDGSLTDLGNIARYDTNNKKWHKMPSRGLNGDVWSFAASGNDVYVGGDFTRTRDGTLTNLGYLARYDTKQDSWHKLPQRSFKGNVRTMLVSDGYLYVGGITSNFNGYVQRFELSSGTWENLSDPVTNAGVWSLAKHNDDLFVGELLGYFNLGIPVQASFGYQLFGLCLITLYMPIFRAGQGWGKSMFGKRASQTGIYPFLQPIKKPKNHKELEAEWKANEVKRAENEEEIDKMIEEGLKLAEKVGLKDKIESFYR